jgi:hypothetical protein
MARYMKLRFEAIDLYPILILLMRRLGWEVETKTVEWTTNHIHYGVRLPNKDRALAEYLIMLLGRTWEVEEIPHPLQLVNPNGRPATLASISQLVALRALRDCKTVALAARRVGVSRCSLWYLAKGLKGIPATESEIQAENLGDWIPERKNPHTYSKKV